MAEWVALGEVEAAAGNQTAAEEAFAVGLELDPQDKTGWERLAALRAEGIEACAPRGGFGTAPGRKLLRQRRLVGLAEPVAGS